MGKMLTYLRSQSYSFSGSFPDENYAREIMQLFTIGLNELHMNGTNVLDDDGNAIPTYDNSHIMAFSRAWTGFDAQPVRANIEVSLYSRPILCTLARHCGHVPLTSLYDAHRCSRSATAVLSSSTRCRSSTLGATCTPNQTSATSILATAFRYALICLRGRSLQRAPSTGAFAARRQLTLGSLLDLCLQ